MKVILITGLDGSGKSTLLSRIESNDNISNYQIIRLPKIDTEKLASDPELYAGATFINHLNEEADIKGITQLKAVALFASMLLYGKILDLAVHSGISTIYCERHPLVDTSIYAQFYAKKLAPGSISKNVLNHYDKKYKKELDFFFNLLPDNISSNQFGSFSVFINFIYDWFYVEKKTSIENLKKIFNVNLPDKIFYLKTTPEILFERIKNRNVLEAHESVEVFTLLDKIYQVLFNDLDKTNTKLVEIVNASSQPDIENLYKLLIDI